jgi:1,5-anhydro-D-fructose reductase (1,5-anhydro-D-mannitol-forming)
MKNVMKSPIRWGIIGCGAVTEIKSGPAYQKTKGFRLAAVMRRNYDKAEDYAKRHGVDAFYTQADDVINNDDIDAIYVATPPDTHKLYALKAAHAGKPCCVEKPLAPCYADSLAIHRAFEERGIPLFVAYYRRSLPLFNEIKKTVDSGAIGEIRHISWNLSQPANQLDIAGTYNWRTDKQIAFGGYFDDLASHGLDLFSYILGEFDEAKGIGLNQQGLYSSLDAISACWSHKSGATGTGSWNFGCHIRQDKVEIHGSKGHIMFSVFSEKPLIICDAKGQHEVSMKNPDNIQLCHVQHIADQLFGGGQHPSNGSSATHTSWVMDKILGRIDSL